MSSFLSMIGILAVAILIVLIIKKVDDYFDERKVGTEISEKICRAAKEFSEGAPEEDVRALLLNCIDLDEDDVEEILERSISFRNEDDGGYDALIKTAKRVIRNY